MLSGPNFRLNLFKEISDEELAANYTFINEKEVEYEIANNKKTFHVGKWARVNNWGGSGRVRIEINWIRKNKWHDRDFQSLC